MKLFVGHLPYDLNDNELKELFETFGTVQNATIIIDRDTGRSKGFGFVEMANSDEAHEAMNKLNNSEVKGRSIVVNPAKDKESRPPRDRNMSSPNSGNRRFSSPRDRNNNNSGRRSSY